MPPLLRQSVAPACLLLLAAAAAQAQPHTRADCEATFRAAWGRAGKDVPWVPTFDAVVLAMLSMTQVTPEDRVLDLGAGDGRIAITAAKPPFGARATGIEYDPELAKLAACLVQVEGVADRVRIVQGDIFKEDFGDASVVTMYLLPHINLCVRHRLLAMKAGTRVVSHQYAMAEWKPDQSVFGHRPRRTDHGHAAHGHRRTHGGRKAPRHAAGRSLGRDPARLQPLLPLAG